MMKNDENDRPICGLGWVMVIHFDICRICPKQISLKLDDLNINWRDWFGILYSNQASKLPKKPGRTVHGFYPQVFEGYILFRVSIASRFWTVASASFLLYYSHMLVNLRNLCWTKHHSCWSNTTLFLVNLPYFCWLNPQQVSLVLHKFLFPTLETYPQFPTLVSNCTKIHFLVVFQQWRSPDHWSSHDFTYDIPSGKHRKNYGKSPFSMGKSTISMVMFNSHVKLPEGIPLLVRFPIHAISCYPHPGPRVPEGLSPLPVAGMVKLLGTLKPWASRDPWWSMFHPKPWVYNAAIQYN